MSQSTTLPTPRVVSILRDVGRALAFAHTHGIVHRDIKPENILLSGATAVVTDFGIAKAFEDASAPSAETNTMLTRFGTCVGTPRYMAPEQIVGDPAIDHRADIYSFGIVGYELIAGRLPFDERDALAHLAVQPEHLRELRVDAPRRLADLVMRCIERERDLRPQGMAEVLMALEDVGPR